MGSVNLSSEIMVERLVHVPTVYAIKKSPQTFVYEDPLKESSERGI